MMLSALIILLTLAGCQAAERKVPPAPATPTRSVRTPHASGPPRRSPHVLSVENEGLLFTDNHAGVSGTDAGYSLPIGQQTLWLFGDVFLLDPHAPARTYVGGVSNCALLVPHGSGAATLHHSAFLADPMTGLARQVIRNEGQEDSKTRLWPVGGWYDSVHHRAYTYYTINETRGAGPLDFHVMGSGLACADVSHPLAMRFERLKSSRDSTLWWRADTEPLFGIAVIADVPGPYLYVVGTQRRAGRHYAQLARVVKERIADIAAYEYLTGAPGAYRWDSSVASAADIEGLVDFPGELSISYNAYLGGYLAVQSVDLSERARLSLASQPWGPYHPIAEIGTPHQALAQAFCYAGKEHPELAEAKGQVLYVTYVDSQRYWLQLLKLTLQK